MAIIQVAKRGSNLTSEKSAPDQKNGNGSIAPAPTPSYFGGLFQRGNAAKAQSRSQELSAASAEELRKSVELVNVLTGTSKTLGSTEAKVESRGQNSERLPERVVDKSAEKAVRSKRLRRGKYELYNGSILLSDGEILNVPAAERFRILRAQLERINLSGKKSYHILAVTSAVPEEGKSVVAVNLARALSLDPTAKTLLIDCDLRRPTVHEFWGMERGPGLTEVLAGKMQLSAVIRSPGRGLDVLPAGEAVEDPAQIVEQPLFSRYLQELRKYYRYIVVDCPPALLCPEPISISAVVDTTLLVVRGWRTEKHLVNNAIDAIGRSKIMGIVMNDGMDSSKQYQYYRYYGNPVRPMELANPGVKTVANVSVKGD